MDEFWLWKLLSIFSHYQFQIDAQHVGLAVKITRFSRTGMRRPCMHAHCRSTTKSSLVSFLPISELIGQYRVGWQLVSVTYLGCLISSCFSKQNSQNSYTAIWKAGEITKIKRYANVNSEVGLYSTSCVFEWAHNVGGHLRELWVVITQRHLTISTDHESSTA